MCRFGLIPETVALVYIIASADPKPLTGRGSHPTSVLVSTPGAGSGPRSHDCTAAVTNRFSKKTSSVASSVVLSSESL